MSILSVNGSDAYERETEQNWAAAYAKRLTTELEGKHDEDVRRIDASLEALESDVSERATRTQLDDAVDVIENELDAYATKADLATVANGSAITDGAIYSRHIHEGNVTTGKIHDLNVTSGKLADGAVTSDKIASGAVTAPKLSSGAVTSAKMAAGAVTAEKLYAGAVTSAKIAAGAVTADKLDAGAVTAGKLAADAVIYFNIADGSVHTSKLHNGAVTLSKLSSDLAVYSPVPRQIGTWIDGTPVWRVAISTASSESKYSGDRAFGCLSAADLGVSSLDLIDPIGVSLTCRMGANVGSCSLRGVVGEGHMDPDTHDEHILYYVVSCDNSYIDPDDPADVIGMNGYIEFVTAAENIASA